MSLLLGALGGLGAGLSGVADNRIQNIDQRSLAQMQESLAIAKERRVEEMQKRQEQRGEESTIRAEGRALSNADLARKSQFDFETNPENVQKRTAAELSQLQAKDDYRYSNQAREAAYQGAMSEAKYGPMYEARADNAIASARLDKSIELQYKRLLDRADAARKAAENATDEVKQLEYMDQAMKFEQAAQDMLASGSAALPGETRPTNANPLGLDLGALRDPEGKSDQDLVKDIEATGAKADLGDTEHDAIRQVSVMAKQDKVDRAVGTDYGYGKRADGTNKGKGFLGELKRPDGDVSTEISVGVNIGGKEMEIPTLVPTLTKQEINHLLAGGDPTEAIIQKAVGHAKTRIAQGKSPFAQPGEENSGRGGILNANSHGAKGRARNEAATRKAEADPRTLLDKLTPEITVKTVNAAKGILGSAFTAGAKGVGSDSLQRAIEMIEKRRDLSRSEKDEAIKQLLERSK
jgi:hypothetical protein